jgi:hypothetical protein
MKRTNNLLAKIAEDPGAISAMSLANRRKVAKLLIEEVSALEKALNDSARTFSAQREHRGDRFLSMEELADRLGRPMKAVRRSWLAGMYPFIIGDSEGRPVASEDGLRRWMKKASQASVRSVGIRFRELPNVLCRFV